MVALVENGPLNLRATYFSSDEILVNFKGLDWSNCASSMRDLRSYGTHKGLEYQHARAVQKAVSQLK